MLTVLSFLLLLSAANASGQDEPFEKLKAAMADAACCRYEFLSIIESEVFESTDTTVGTALIAADGRYHISIGPDEYLRTTDKLYSYSSTENQLTVETLGTGDLRPESVSFVTRLNDHYSTRVVVPSRQYFLTLTDTAAADLPDSLSVSLLAGKPGLERIEFFDVNNDRNRIVFSKSEYFDECDESALTPHFPDSAEVINLR
jgi:outer membrane lipoprotein-sorting protein